MRFALLLVVSSAGIAQTQDALKLLRDVADSARTVATWRMEGSIEEIIDSEQLFPASFTLAMKSSGAVKFVQTNGDRPGITACNQSTSFAYSASLHRFRLDSPPDRTVCGPPAGDWEGLPPRLISPKLGEYRKNGIGGRTPACQIIQGEMLPDPPATGRTKRTICVDTNRNLIVWDKSERSRETRTWTYTRIETDVDLTPQDLAFDLPAGSVRTLFDIPTAHHPGELVVPRYAGFVMPHVRSRVDPHFENRNKKTGGLGMISLYVVIGTDGRPADVEVLHSSVPSAIAAEVMRAVSQWRYYPATKDGRPVTVMQTVRWTVNL